MSEVGIDRILFSIDYPYETFELACDWFRDLDSSINPVDLKKLAFGNALALFPHLARSLSQ